MTACPLSFLDLCIVVYSVIGIYSQCIDNYPTTVSVTYIPGMYYNVNDPVIIVVKHNPC